MFENENAPTKASVTPFSSLKVMRDILVDFVVAATLHYLTPLMSIIFPAHVYFTHQTLQGKYFYFFIFVKKVLWRVIFSNTHYIYRVVTVTLK